MLAPRTHAEKLTITSSPSGATVEIDEAVVGGTPYQVEYPGGYFHKTHSVFGSRLRHSMTLRISKDGYLIQRITLTKGPFDWVAVTGRHRGSYFLLKSDRFDITPEPAQEAGCGPMEASGMVGPIHPHSLVAVPVSAGGTASDTGTVTTTTDQPSAEIYVDGEFVGQTPSTIPLATGSHHIGIKANGKEIWERDLEGLKDSRLTLQPAFDR